MNTRDEEQAFRYPRSIVASQNRKEHLHLPDVGFSVLGCRVLGFRVSDQKPSADITLLKS